MAQPTSEVVTRSFVCGTIDRVCLVDRVKSEIALGMVYRAPAVLVGKQDSEIEVAYQPGGGLAGNIEKTCRSG